MSQQLQKFGVIGLGVMGRNIALNIERNGFPIAVYNRSPDKREEFAQHAKGKNARLCSTVQELVASLERPRRILLMVNAGAPVDMVTKELLPLLNADDIIIDGGNSLYSDTERRSAELDKSGTGVKFFGMGVSGGEEGALWGPSIMPGGDETSYKHLEPVLQKIAAKTPDDGPCVSYIGRGGAGHFVKMTHNGIEYGDMQLIAEAYDLLKTVGGLNNKQLEDVFNEWNSSELQSFLIDITAKVINFKDPSGTGPLVEQIRDVVGMKGTGTWTIKAALDTLVPAPTMNAAVEQREISAIYGERQAASNALGGPTPRKHDGDLKQFISDVKAALYCSKVCSYAQGFVMMAAADKVHKYGLRMDEIARIWKAGCIIRAKFLDDIKRSVKEEPHVPNLLMTRFFKEQLASRQDAWRRVAALSITHGITAPAFVASLGYYDTYRRARLPGNLIQAQRDFFGAHTYERLDAPGKFVHTQWAPESQHTPHAGGHGAQQTSKITGD
jgi:6-phosphogluconate dehydrogenase